MVLHLPYDHVVLAEGWDDGPIAIVLCDDAGIEAKQIGIFSVALVCFIICGERDNSEVVLGQQVAVTVE